MATDAESATLRITEALGSKSTRRGMARDLQAYLQCFGKDGRPVFSREQIERILKAVGDAAVHCADEGDDRGLARMTGCLTKLADVAEKVRQAEEAETSANELISRLRNRAAGA